MNIKKMEEDDLDGLGRTPLHLAAENSDIDQLEELLRSGSYDVNGQDVRGQTPLYTLSLTRKLLTT